MHKVKCFYCGEIFDRDKEPFGVVQTRRYAHQECFDLKAPRHKAEPSKEELDLQALKNYISIKLGTSANWALITKQIEKYRQEYRYTLTGMLKTLIYFYDVKNGDNEKAKGGIGIIPFVYDDANRYYYSIWLARQTNAEIDIQPIDTIEVHIQSPQREPMSKRRSLFSFLNEEREENT